MIVLHPYQHLHETVRDTLLGFWPEAQVTYVAATRWGYWEAVKALWGTDDLVIVEQHKEIHDRVMPEFAACPQPWCRFPHELINKGNWAEGIGCVRFRRELMQDVTPADVENYYGSCWECAGDGTAGGFGIKPARPGCWRHLDGVLINLLRERGYQECIHQPGVRHWKVYHPEEHCELL